MTQIKTLKEILTIIDQAPRQFESQIPAIEKKIFGDISLLLKNLKVSESGKIEAGIENLKLINEIKAKLGNIVISKQYAGLVDKFVQNIPLISNFQTATAGVPAESKKMLTAVAKIQINNTLESLIGSGYKQEIVSKLYNTLLTNVTSGGSYSDMIEQLQKQLVSAEGKAGLLSKYTKTWVVDTLGEFSGQGNKMIADALRSEWFRYVGSNLATTREFCEHLTKKDYVHKSEIPELLKGKIDGHQCKISESTGLPLGMKADTNVDNFIEHRGGWNCGHQLVPVNEATVPEAVKARIRQDEKRKQFTESRKSVIEHAKLNIIGKKVYRKELGSDIEFTKKGIKEALNQRHEKYLDKNEAIKDIVSLLKKAPYIESIENFKKAKKPSISKYHYFGINIAGMPSQIVIEENNIGRLVFYSITKEKTKRP